MKPRVIAAEVKKDLVKDVTTRRDDDGPKPQIAGVLSVVGGTSSEPRWVEVLAGHLVVHPPAPGPGRPCWRLPLRHLHLQPAASGRPRGFSLTPSGESSPVVTFQAGSDADYWRWVRLLAAELLKQTPLEAVKFLDILGITASSPVPPAASAAPATSATPATPATPAAAILARLRRGHRPDESARSRVQALLKNFRSAERPTKIDTGPPKETVFPSAAARLSPTSPPSPRSVGDPRPPLPDVVRDLPPCDRRSRPRVRAPPLRLRGKSVDVLPAADAASASEDPHVAELRVRCQQEDRYVPVRDKRLLFESLGRAASQPRFLSSDDLPRLGVCRAPPPYEPARTRSLHDLRGALPNTTAAAVKQICRYFEQRGGSRGELTARSPSPSAADCRLWSLPSSRPAADKPSHSHYRRSSEERRLPIKISPPASNHFGIAAPQVRHHSDIR